MRMERASRRLMKNQYQANSSREDPWFPQPGRSAAAAAADRLIDRQLFEARAEFDALGVLARDLESQAPVERHGAAIGLVDVASQGRDGAAVHHIRKLREQVAKDRRRPVRGVGIESGDEP